MNENEKTAQQDYRTVSVDYDPFADHPSVTQYDSTDAQREIWSSVQMDDRASCAFNESVSLEFRGELDTQALEQSLASLVERHEALRTTFSPDGQQVTVRTSPLLALRHSDRNAAEEIKNEAQTIFDLETGPLIRFVLVHQSADHQVLILTAHHIVCDGWSLAILVQDLGNMYSVNVGRRDQNPLAPSTPFSEYAETMLSSDSDEAYWLARFTDGVPAYELPIDLPRPEMRRFESERLDIEVDSGLIERTRTQARRLGVSYTAYMMAAFFVCLQKWTRENILAVGLPTAGQASHGPETLVGHCVNMLPIYTQMAQSQTFAELAREVADDILTTFEHRNFTYGSLVEKLALSRDPSRLPLLSVLFNVDQGIRDDDLAFAGLKARFFSNPRFYENFELFINASDYGSRFIIECQYQTSLFTESTVRQRMDEYQRVLQQVSEDADVQTRQIRLISAEQQAQLLARGDGPTVDIPRTALVDAILQQGSAQADKIAVRHAQDSLSYGELLTRSRQLAHYLRSQAIQPGDRVGVCLPRGVDMLVALLGIWQTGAAYVPLDPEFPTERLSYMIEDAGIDVALCSPQTTDQVQSVRQPWSLEALADTLAQQPTDPLSVPDDPAQAAYIIYTSGSTGRPKGVIVSQGAVLNFLTSMAQRPGLTAEDRLLAVTTLSFDIAVLELYLPLMVGAEVVIASRDDTLDGRRLIQQLSEHHISAMQATPATWRLLLSSGWSGDPQLKALCGGEALPKDLAADLLPKVGRLWNLYGPTETTVWSTCTEVTRTDTEQPYPLTIGTAIGNTQLYVLDESLQPVPQGVAGELFIGGLGVALGYHDRPDLTAERFVDCPADLGPGQGKLYRTGDKVRYRHDGQLEYLGRMDQQVKVRGFRIELGEIESQLRSLPAISDCAVTVKEERSGDSRLVAYVVWQDRALTMTEIRQVLKATLPQYMIPQHVETLNELPRTLNGKLDRNRLAQLALADSTSTEPGDLTEPVNDTERSLLAIWQSVLNTRLIGTEDNFFDLGGHSLLIAKIIQAVEADSGVRLQFRDLYTAPTIKELATFMTEHSEKATKVVIPNVPESEPALLSLAQQRLWYLSKFEGNSTAFNLPSAFRLRGLLDSEALNRAFTRMINRHTVLRTRIIEQSDMPMQIVEPTVDYQLPVIDLSNSDDQESLLNERLLALQSEHFEPSDYPLFRATLLKLNPEDHVLFFMPHHLVFDGWSFDLYVHELTHFYSVETGYANSDLPSLPIQYRDYAQWMRDRLKGEELNSQVEYWTESLAGSLPVLEFPTDYPRPDMADNQGEQILFQVDPQQVSQLQRLALTTNSSLFMVLMTSYLVLLSRYTGQDDIIVGAPMADRTRSGTENLIGFFVNALVLRFSVSPEQTFQSLLHQVKETCLSGFNHQDAPFERLVEVLNPARDLSRAPLFQTSLTYQDVTARETSMADLQFDQVEIPSHDSPLDFNLWFKKRGPKLTGALVFSSSLFTRSTMAQMAAHYQQILTEVISNSHARISDYRLLSQSAKTQLLARGDGPTVDIPRTALVDAILQQGSAQADKIAVRHAQDSLSYGELLTRSRQLAHYLRSQAIQPGDRVGVCLPRGVDMLVALLGIWQTGAAYVPLDPEFPTERLSYMIEDAGIDVALCSPQTTDQVQSVRQPWSLEALADTLAQQPTDPLSVPDDPAQAAYIIYTSGSTGRPKGVIVSQGAVLNFLTSMAQRPGLTAEDRLLAVTTLSFDIAVLELYLPLMVGAEVVIASRDDTLDGRRLIQQLSEHHISAMQATPATWRLLLSSGWSGDPQLKALCGGEALPKDLAADLLPKVGRLWNLYGPTETTVWSTCTEVTRTDTEQPYPLTIGTAIGNTQLYVLDESLQPVPQGVAGELFIGGLGVALGYHDRPDLTAERFVDCPADLGPGQGKLYRTGDKVRYRHDGQLEYLGRMDQQVKVRGFRIELGEIESQLRSLPAISDCAVTVKEERSGDSRLVAYVVWQDRALTMTEIRQVLKATLPQYMIPQHVETLNELPRTLNGKLDRNRLAQLSVNAVTTAPKQPPKTDTEAELASIWHDVTGATGIARFDNFFAVGGHSLLSMQVIQEVRRRWNAQVSPKDLLLESLQEIARLIDAQKVAVGADVQSTSNEPEPGLFGRLMGRLGNRSRS